MTPNDLIATRVTLGLSQAELARLLDVPASTISRWERGLNKIASPRILALALERLAELQANGTRIGTREAV